MGTPVRGGSSRTQLVSAIVVIAILLGALAFFYVNSSQTVAGLQSTTSAQASTITMQSSSIVGLNAQITGLNTQITNLQAQVQSDQQSVANLNHTVITLRTQHTTDQNTIDDLNSQISSLQTQIAADNSHINTLEAIVNMHNSSVLWSSHTVIIITGTNETSASFATPYAGYFLISYTATWNFQLEVDFNGGVTRQTTSPASGVNPNYPELLAVLPGTTTLIIHNGSCLPAPAGCPGITGTMTITYVY